ncbi:MAG: FtsX-like permease family protein, partial [Saprospiraceae bacterium]|nr:FtsX-like permease family protein [Saprospiraceae bacterium]
GQTLQLRGRDFEITGILEEVPANSQFRFDIMVSMHCAEQVFSRIVLENWGEGYVETFVQVPPGASPDTYEDQLEQFVADKLQAWSAFSPRIRMQPLDKLYLHSRDISSFANGGDITYVYAFSFIALFILIIACINFMNLATARAGLRSKEVGLRKVVGASRRQLIGQFLSESTVLAVISLGLALGIAQLAMPFFNQLADKNMTLSALLDGPVIAGLLGITLFVGLAAGSYPALILSAFKPIHTLAGEKRHGLRGGKLRRVLVGFQFATSIFLLVVTGIVYKQLNYCKSVDLGYDKDHVLVFGTPVDLRSKYDQFRSELLSNPRVVNAAGSSRVPPGSLSSSLQTRPEGVPEDQRRGMQTVWTDYDFIETMGFNMAAGRSFSREFPADATTGFILNEAAVRELGWTNESAIGKTFGSMEITDWNSGQWVPRDGQVIGVLEDFHFESLKNQIVPTVYFIAPYMAWNYVVRVRPEQLNASISSIEKTWEQFNPGIPFEYTFVDENFAQLYQTEERQGRIFATFALLAIFIACLGLIGLASFTAERKKKEVGIRKVLGASSFNLVMLLTREFTWLVVLAFVVAAPVGWYVMQNWLRDFAYQTRVGVTVFIAAGGIAVLIAWLTVGLQTARTAYSNPVKALRQE